MSRETVDGPQSNRIMGRKAPADMTNVRTAAKRLMR